MMAVVIDWNDPDSCRGCKWYHEWFGVCCNGDSEQRADVSHRCDLYDEVESPE